MINLMLCQPGDISNLSADRWSFEAKHDGNRLLVSHKAGSVEFQSRSGRDSTDDYKLAISSEFDMLLDGEVVSLNASGVPEFNLIQNRATTRIEFWAFDILELDGRDLSRVPYRQRREILEKVGQLSTGFHVPPLIDAADGKQAQQYSVEMGLEGVIAKAWDSRYEFGKRSKNWLKSKNWLEQDVVVGGWKWGTGRRADTIGSVLVGVPEKNGLRFCGRVGTGFNDSELATLLRLFQSIQTTISPFSPAVTGHDAKNAQYVEPQLTAAVQYGLMTADGRMRHPSWRGLR